MGQASDLANYAQRERERRSHLEDICLAGVSSVLLIIDSLEMTWSTTAECALQGVFTGKRMD